MDTSKVKSISKDEIAKARKQVLDLIQTTYGHTPQWNHVRSRLLKIFGRDGLEGLVNGSTTEHGADYGESHDQ